MKNTTHLILGMLALTFGMEAMAQIQLPSVFSDGMVLQQNSKVAVWGWGNPSETLMILSEWNPGDTVRTVVDNQGRWKAEVPTGRAGGPYTLEVKGGNDSRKLSDVMLGEVWLCSGQSNMEWSADMGIMNGEQEVKQAACPSVRIFHNPKQGADTPQTDCRTKWAVATPESMRKTSATAYFFARYLTEHLKVPVGILVSAWGGTPAEVWTPADIVEKDEILSKNKLKDYPWWPIKPAPHTYGAKNNTPALLREQQELMLGQVKNTAMINISDLVENVKDIHPRNKRAIGERLACLAMDKVYGQFTGAYESPRLHDARVVKRNLEVTLEGNFNTLHSTTKRGQV